MDRSTQAIFERIAIALEQIAVQINGNPAPSTREPMTARTRKIMLSHFAGLYVTVDQAREALGMTDASSKAVGQVLAAAGFERRRWATGVRFAICEPGGNCSGSPITLPENLADAVEAARAALKNYGRKTDARGVIYGAYLMQGVTAKPSLVTAAHIEEVLRQYPEFAGPLNEIDIG